MLDSSEMNGLWLGRVWRDGVGPAVVTLREGQVVDITSRAAPTARAAC